MSGKLTADNDTYYLWGGATVRSDTQSSDITRYTKHSIPNWIVARRPRRVVYKSDLAQLAWGIRFAGSNSKAS